jgi:hypothetical protein
MISNPMRGYYCGVPKTFVRWKTEGGLSCRAVLVETPRTTSGPRQRHVAYLGSFKEDNLTQDNARAWFWQGARKRLDQLGICGKITSRDREMIEAALVLRVPPMTPEQGAMCNRESEESWQR